MTLQEEFEHTKIAIAGLNNKIYRAKLELRGHDVRLVELAVKMAAERGIFVGGEAWHIFGVEDGAIIKGKHVTVMDIHVHKSGKPAAKCVAIDDKREEFNWLIENMIGPGMEAKNE